MTEVFFINGSINMKIGLAATERAEKADGVKYAIQEDLIAHAKTPEIGLPGKRRQTFALLNEHLLTKHFSLRYLDGGKVPQHHKSAEEIVESAEQYYAHRCDVLSVADYVTDFPDIVAACHLLVSDKGA